MERNYDVRLITRNDYDYNWENSTLVLLKGELAISIPTKEEGNEHVTDPDALPTLFLGDGQHSAKDSVFKGTLLDLAATGSVDDSEDTSALKIVKNSEGKHVIQLTQAHKKEDNSFIGGILKPDDYQAVDAVVNAFKGTDGKVTSATILSVIESKSRGKFDIDDDDNMIYTETSETVSWSCGGSNNLIN